MTGQGRMNEKAYINEQKTLKRKTGVTRHLSKTPPLPKCQRQDRRRAAVALRGEKGRGQSPEQSSYYNPATKPAQREVDLRTCHRPFQKTV